MLFNKKRGEEKGKICPICPEMNEKKQSIPRNKN